MRTKRIKITKTGNSGFKKSISTILYCFSFIIILLATFFLLPRSITPLSEKPAPLQKAVFQSHSVTGSIIEIQSETIVLGEQVTVAITSTVAATATLDAFTFHIEYDPSILGYMNCNLGSDFLGLCYNSDNDGVPPDVVSFSGVEPFGVNGILSLGDITFSGDAAGISQLHIIVDTWNDANPSPPVMMDGQIIVESSATPTPTNTSTQAPTNTPTQTATPSPTPSHTTTSTPTATSTSTLTLTPTSTPTETPSETPTLIPTHTLTPTPTLTPEQSPEFEAFIPIVLNQ